MEPDWKTLTPASRKWVAELRKQWLFEPHHLQTLHLAATALDRLRAAAETLRAEGLTFTDAHGRPARHPAVSIERDSAATYLRALRELGLDVDQGRDGLRRGNPAPGIRWRS